MIMFLCTSVYKRHLILGAQKLKVFTTFKSILIRWFYILKIVFLLTISHSYLT